MSKDSSFKKPNTLAGVYRLLPAIFITIGSALLFLAGQFIGILIFTVLLSLFGMSPEGISESLINDPATKLAAVLAIETISIGLVFLLLKYIGETPKKFLNLNKRLSLRNLKYIAISYGLYFISFITIASIAPLLISGLDVEQQQQLGYGAITGLDYVYVLITLVILPPIAEEILFRGFLFKSLKKTVNIKVAVIITSVLFGAAHLEFMGDNPLNWIAGIDTFVFSLFLIWLYQKTNNLWAPIILHAFKNFIAYVVLFII